MFAPSSTHRMKQELFGEILVVENNFHPKCDNHSFKLPQTWHRTYSGPWQYTHKVLSARKWKVLAIGEEQAYSFHFFCLTKKKESF